LREAFKPKKKEIKVEKVQLWGHQTVHIKNEDFLYEGGGGKYSGFLQRIET